jgi:hypothetical protein
MNRSAANSAVPQILTGAAVSTSGAFTARSHLSW